MSAPLVDNQSVRAAVAAFAERPAAETVVEVLRQCLQGELLLDITGSSIQGDASTITAGSTIRVNEVTGPDGNRALAAFTSNDELRRAQPPGTDVLSLGQPAAGVLEFARQQGYPWLYLNPAGPSCVLSASDIDFALRIPRNDAVKKAIPGPREGLLVALRQDGPLHLAAASGSAEPGVIEQAQPVQVRTSTDPAGQPMLLAFTSGPEVSARHLDDLVVRHTTADVLRMAREGGYAGLVLNPAGPYAVLPRAELESVA